MAGRKGFYRRAVEAIMPRARQMVEEAVREQVSREFGLPPEPPAGRKVGFAAMTREQHREASRKGALAGHAKRRAQ